MGASSNLIAASMAMQAGSTIATSYQQSKALEAQGDYQKQQSDFNARLADKQGEDALKRGDKAAGQHMSKVKQLVGSQRVAMAAQGIDIDSGTAAELQDQTLALGEADAITIKNNAWREAWGFGVEAENSRSQGSWAKLSSKNQSRNTLLTGGMQAASYGAGAYGEYLKGKDPKPGVK